MDAVIATTPKIVKGRVTESPGSWPWRNKWRKNHLIAINSNVAQVNCTYDHANVRRQYRSNTTNSVPCTYGCGSKTREISVTEHWAFLGNFFFPFREVNNGRRIRTATRISQALAQGRGTHAFMNSFILRTINRKEDILPEHSREQFRTDKKNSDPQACSNCCARNKDPSPGQQIVCSR